MASIFGDYIHIEPTQDASATKNLTEQYSELVALQQDAMGHQLYPSLSLYTTPVKKAERPIVGREKEMDSVLAAMMRAELCNVMLLAEAGTGKTALVQGTMLHDAGRLYLEVNLSKMIADLTDPNQMADKLKMLFSETQAFRQAQNIEIVLFMDEFHQVVQLSAAAVEALKPLLADSGTRGVRVIAATTYIEFRKFIQPNQPLVERFQRINLSQPDKATTVQILKSMAKRYGVGNQIHGDHLFEMIYEYTNRYIPANSQPRKSIIILDSMVGWYKYKKRKMDVKLLADVIYEAEGVNVAFRVDATKIKKELDAHVFAQEYATQMLENRLQVCVADLNDKSKPMSSFLFSGSTGVGKGLLDDTLVPVYDKDGKTVYKRNGDLVIGDYVYNRLGKPVQVTGVYHRGLQDLYEVILADGRSLITDSSHLWTYIQSKGKYTENTYTNSTKELYDRGVNIVHKPTGKVNHKYYIPMNGAVEYPDRHLVVDPYVMGVFIGDGCMTISQLTLSSNDEEVVHKVADRLGGCSYKRNTRNYSWTFPLDEPSGHVKTKQTKSVFGLFDEVYHKTSANKRIPYDYMYSSVADRWALIQGLFDTDGHISDKDGGRYNISFSSVSFNLIKDIQKVLYSLGVASTYHITRHATDEHIAQYRLNVKSSNLHKDRFFSLPRKLEIAMKAKNCMESKSRKKDYTLVAIQDIQKLDYQGYTTCIMVDDEEHLYQAGDFVVSHNTEMTKQLARVLFQDEHRLIRFDMTEYANPDSLDHFRKELTNRVWERPYSIILLDEIEKACAPVTRILLQVLDDGRLMDENNREVVFTNAYVILTTNAGSEVYESIAQYASDDSGSGLQMKKYEKNIRDSISGTTGDNRFPPELLGRIDCIIPFQPLSEATQMAIIRAKLDKLAKEVKTKHNIDLAIHTRVIDYLVKDNLDTEASSGGARAAINKMNAEVTAKVARFINANPDVTEIIVNIDGDMAFENKSQLESRAYVTVKPRKKQ